MDPLLYWLGIVLAILSGMVINYGMVLQKKIVNKHKHDEEFLKNLAKNHTWLLGLVLQFVLGTIFMLTAQLFIGPALIPGLMASGLIILVVSSIKILGETLTRQEILGIALMILATVLLGLSELSIPTEEIYLLDPGLIIRTTTFTTILVMVAIMCEFAQKKILKYRGLLLALFCGLFLSISNFWISPLMTVFEQGNFSFGYIVIFIIASIILVLTNIFALTELQKAFIVGQASNIIPIQTIPQQIAPIFVFFYVFLLEAPTVFSIWYVMSGVILIIISSFLLGKRQAQMEEIKT